MLAIRMQRTGRKGHAMFRMVVQDARRTPSSGKVVAYIGSYDPHSKKALIDTEKAGYFLEHGAQPSDRVVQLLEQEKVSLPKWVNKSSDKKREVRNPDKRRSTAPKTEEQAPSEKPATENVPASEAEPTDTSENEA